MIETAKLHRPCDCGSNSDRCEVCDERWPCPTATSAEAAIQRVRELHRHRMGGRYYVCAECGDNVSYPCATRRLVDNDPWGFLRALDRGAE